MPESKVKASLHPSSHAVLLGLGVLVAGLGALLVSATLPPPLHSSPLPSSGSEFALGIEAEKPIAKRRAKQDNPLAPVRRVVAVQRGTGMMQTLLDAGISSRDAHDIVESIEDHVDLRRIPTGQEVILIFPPVASASVEAIALELDGARFLRATRLGGGGWHAETRARVLYEREFHAGNRIDSSLYEAAQEAGLSESVIHEIIRISSHSVDFQRDIHPGDEFEVFYTQMLDRHGHVADSKPQLLYLSLRVQGEALRLWRHEEPTSGHVDYFDAEGRSMKRLLMRTPIDGARLSSGFGMRKHPILGYSRMHRGLDFAAPTGTPVYASGNGTITRIERNGDYGNMIRLRHANGYETLYAHLNAFAKGMKQGVRVAQGETIGYVGSSGLSTGPHLHYEVHHRGTSLNPQSLDIPLGRVLEGSEMSIFQAERVQMRERMAQTIAAQWSTATVGQRSATVGP